MNDLSYIKNIIKERVLNENLNEYDKVAETEEEFNEYRQRMIKDLKDLFEDIRNDEYEEANKKIQKYVHELQKLQQDIEEGTT